MPLNIFEPRYIQMVSEALEQNRPIAISYDDPTEPSPGRPRIVAGYGLPTLLEKRPDGTLLIVVRGTGKARLGKVIRSEPFIVCEAFDIRENLSLDEGNRFRMRRYQRAAERWIDEQVPEQAYRDTIRSSLDSPEKIIEFLASHMVKDPDVREQILEIDDINERISILQKLGIDSGSSGTA